MSPRDEARFELLCDRLNEGDAGTLAELWDLAAGDPARELEVELLEHRDPAMDRPLEGADAELLERTLGRVLGQERPPLGRRRPPRGARRSMKALLVAVAVLVLSGLVAAQYWRQETEMPPAPAEPMVPLPVQAPDETTAPETPPVELAPADTPTPAEDTFERAEPAEPEDYDRPARSPLTAAELFERAGQARRQARSEEAGRLYRRLQARYPESPEALASRLSLARLLASSLHDPRAALAQLDGYLERASDGVLAPECRYQRALVLRRLGRQDAEMQALTESLARDPESVYAVPARRRLDELQAAGEDE